MVINPPHFATLPAKLKTLINLAYYNNTLCPDKALLFHAWYCCKPEDIKVIIISTEPYNIPSKSNGLAFGIHKNYKQPIGKALNNLLREVKDSTGSVTNDLTLESWAKQGVMLINLYLSTVKGKINGHKVPEWEHVVTEYIKDLQKQYRYNIYMLWGTEAQQLSTIIDNKDNLVLTAAHPYTPMFKGCDHFALANEYLGRRGREEIKW